MNKNKLLLENKGNQQGNNKFKNNLNKNQNIKKPNYLYFLGGFC